MLDSTVNEYIKLLVHNNKNDKDLELSVTKRKSLDYSVKEYMELPVNSGNVDKDIKFPV